jgi:hypothetical protein
MTITLTREEAQQVLDALSAVWKMDRSTKHGDAIETLRARLAQPEPEPVSNVVIREGLPCLVSDRDIKPSDKRLYTAPPQQNNLEPVVWMYQDKSTNEVRFQKHMRDFVDHGQTYEMPLYTTPPQREWQGLTADEQIALVAEHKDTPVTLMFETEAKLKEKNNG